MSDQVISSQVMYKGVFSVIKVAVRLSSGDVMERELIESPGGSAVLPYDPQRGVALMISEPRAPVLHEDQRRMLEVIGGAYDGDGAEECARREALEEAGVALRQLEHVGCAWPSPANSTERIDYFLAAYSSADRVASGGGLAEEQEHISVCEVPLRSLKEMVAEGRIRDAKTLILSQALLLRHPDLFY